MPGRFDSGRVEAFSDGVFAIAVTLLVLEISVPLRDFGDLWNGIADQWPSYLGYTTSFFTIGGLWMVHHALFRRMRHADATVIRVNLLLLWVVAFLPFPTRLVAEALTFRTNEAERAAVLFYGGTLLAITLTLTALASYVTSRSELLGEEVPPAEMQVAVARTRPTPTFYGVILVLALVAPAVAAWGFLVVAVSAVLLPVWPGSRPPRRASAG